MSPATGPDLAAQSVFVLHRRPYRETSLLVDFLCEDGLLRAVCRGARGRLAGVLQPFGELEITLRGRGDLGTLTGAESVYLPHRLTGSGLYCGMYLNEVLTLTLRKHAPSAGLFSKYAETVGGLLNADRTQQEILLRRFEFHLLASLGYGLQTDHASDTGEALNTKTVFVVPLEGIFIHRPPTSATEVPVDVLHAICSDDYSSTETRRFAKTIARAEIDALTGGRPLISRSLFARQRG